MSQTVKSELVSVIVPVYNRTQLLEECVLSAQHQTYKKIEIIIVDDGSDDDATPALISKLARRDRTIRIVTSPENEGPGSARNRGLEAASGRYIQYLDSDDLLRPRKIEAQVQLLQARPECGLSYCRTLRPYCSNPDQPWARTGEDVGDLLPSLLMQRPWGTLSVLWRRSVCDRIGKWGSTRVMEDWEYDCRAAILGTRAIYCPEPLAVIRDHDSNRASGLGVGFTRAVTRDYFMAHRNIYRALIAAGQRQHMMSVPFANKLFWIARMCGARGLRDEAREALGMARRVCSRASTRVKIEMFSLVVAGIGWKNGVRFCERARILQAKDA